MAFSCKGRLCPSCWARRAADTAADLVDRVLPEARYRQWVLTFPWQMRYLLATDRAFQGAVLRTSLRTVGAWMRLRARRLGLPGGQVGAVTFVQRFGGILNLNPHFHTLMPDGVFLEDADAPGGPLAFVALPPPTDADIAALGLRLATRIGDLARQRFRQAQNDPPWQAPDDLPLRITVAPADRLGLERLCRYGLRAPFSQDRLSLDPDGRVRYRLHRPWPTPEGRTEIVLEPLAFLRRLAALLPAPYQNLVRYHGVFANRSRFRNRLPDPPPRTGEPASAPATTTTPDAAPATTASPAPTAAHDASPPDRPRRVHLGWAQLLRRVLDIDALQCPRCPSHRPLVVLAFLTDPAVVRRILEHRARRLGLRGGQVGAVTFVQRFGGILNLNPHFHTLMPDGVFIEDADAPGGPLALVTLPPPSDADIAALGLRLATRIGELARQRFRRTQDDPPWQDPDELPLRITVAEAVQPPGPRPPRTLPWDATPPPDDQGSGKTPAKALCIRVQGFSLHAARTVAPGDRPGLERLCRYGLRAPFSLDRLSLDPDGRVRYRLHRPWPTPEGRTEIVLEPVAFLRRLAALLPAPYQNLVRYHGVFANRSRFRNRLPAPPARSGETEVASAARTTTDASTSAGTASPAPAAAASAPGAAPAAPPPDHPRRTHLGWAQLLRRVLDIDALQCPRCPSHRPLVVLAFLTAPAVVRRLLEHLGLPAATLPVAQARRVDWESDCGTGQRFAGWDGCDADWGTGSAGDDVRIHDPARAPP